MAYNFDKTSGDIIINGFQNGIADSPYEGIGDLRNVNITPIPSEASVNFSTAQISPPAIPTGTVSSANAGTYYLTYTGAAGLENYMTVYFTAQSGLLPNGNSDLNIPFWVLNLGAGVFQLTSDYAQSTVIHVTNGTGTFSVAKVGTTPNGTNGVPKYSVYDPTDNVYFMLTTAGDLWSNIEVTGTNSYWTYLGLNGNTSTGSGENAYGTGLIFYQSSDTTKRYVFVMRNTTIDYFNCVSLGWEWAWVPSTAQIQQGGTATIISSAQGHAGITAYNNIAYYCNTVYIEEFYEATGKTFDPTDATTYVYVNNKLLSNNDSAQSLAFLGVTLMIGGKLNYIYIWDTTSPSFNNIIQLAESNVVQLVSVNTNLFIFVGNRGRIYITNGSQAQVYKKMPDFLSGTVEPYYIWGGACSNKNQLYFGVLSYTNTNTTLATYGGVWAIDLDTKALRMTNTLSYQTTTYNGYATTIIPVLGTTPAGVGLFIGWNNASSTSGIDSTVSAPYIGGTAVAVGIINSDMIPIGTYLKPNTSSRVEFKLAIPLASGESVQLFYRQKLSDSFTAIGAVITNSTVGFNKYSWAYTSVNFENSQWLQIQAQLISENTAFITPSYCRLTEMRVSSM